MNKFSILEDYNAPEGVHQFFEDNNIDYSMTAVTKHDNGKITLIHSVICSDEDVLFISIKYPALVIKKISSLE